MSCFKALFQSADLLLQVLDIDLKGKKGMILNQ